MTNPPQIPHAEDSNEPLGRDGEHSTESLAETLMKPTLGPGEVAAPPEKLVTSDLPPNRIGRFEIRRQLGAGAFGEVFLGYDATLDRHVAIKCPKRAQSESVIQSFLSEAQRLAQLQHPGIVVVYDIGRDADRCFIVTEYLEGEVLQASRSRPADWPKSVEIVCHLANALGHAHSRGIMHRDIKPSNIMMTVDGRCVLMDFGLAVNDLKATRGEVAGTPTYMSPEQIRGESHRVDGRTDIYAIGVVFYELLTGRLPFRSPNRHELFRKIQEDAPQPIRQLNPAVPEAVEAVCNKALAKKMEDRFTTAYDFAEALKAAAEPKAVVLSGDSIHQMKSTIAEVPSVAPPSSVVGASSDSSQTRRLKEAELRLVTLVSLGFDVSARGIEVEDLHAISQIFSSTISTLAANHGGSVSTTSGQEVEICFGFPVAYEDSPRRAIRCAMELLQLTEQDAALPKRDELVIAIHSGLTIAEETVHGVKVTGETIQTLRRLVTVVEAGSVIVTESTHKASRIYFDQELLGPVTVRGIAGPITLYRVIKEAPVTLNRVELVDPGNLTPLVGRDTEFGILKDRWEQASEALGQIVLLIGEAGLGKSRLIREIREHVIAEGMNPDIIELRCSQYHQSTGLHPMVEHLSQLLQLDQHPTSDSRLAAVQRYLESLGLAGDRNTALMAQLLGVDASQLPQLDVSPQKKRDLTSAFLLDLLKQRSELRPVLFIVEDLHWVDPTLLELLTAYVEGFDQSRSLSIFTFRPEFETPWKSKPHQTQIALNRLTKRQIRDMMRKRLHRENLPDVIVEQVIQRTDGIPLFIEEFSTLLAETGSLDEGSATESAVSQAIPASLQDLLMARLDRMASDPEVIQLAAAIGREFSYSLLKAASDLKPETLQGELDKLVSAEVLFRKGEYPEASFIFKHALIQDSAYNSVLKKRRQGIHGRIGAALESHFPEIVGHQPELVAHHFTEADNLAKGAEYWLKAGVKAQGASANVEAISHLTYGLKILQAMPESAPRDQLELGFQLTLAPVLMAARGWSAPEVGTAIERARQLLAGIGSLEEKFFVMWGLWGWRVIRSDMDIATPIADDMMKMAQSSPEGAELLAEACWCVGCTDYYKGNFKTGLELLEKGLALIDSEKERAHSLKTGQRCSLMCRSHAALALWELGFPDQALQLTDENVRLGRDQNHPFTLAMSLFFRRRILEYCELHDRARASIEDEYKICHENGFVFFKAHAIFGRGALLLREGKIDEARAQFDLGLELRAATGGNLSMDYAYCRIAEAYLMAGLPNDAREWLDRAFDIVNNHNERGLESECLRLQGLLEIATGNQNAAEASYQRAIQIARQQQARSRELKASISLVDLKRQHGGPQGTLPTLNAIYESFTEGTSTADLVRAKELLESAK